MTRQKLNNFLALALAIVLSVGLLPTQASAASITFTDVSKDAWYYNDVMACANAGVVSGVGDNKFAPNNNVANPEMIKMVVNAYFLDEYNAYEAQHKTEMLNYFGEHLYWFSGMSYFAKQNGLLNGINVDITAYGTYYKPMSRNDMAMLLTNVAKAKGIAATDSEKKVAKAELMNYDWYDIPTAYQDAVANCFALGLLNGKNGYFDGSANMTRAEACAVIIRLGNLIENNGGSTIDPGPIETPEPTPSVPMDIKVTNTTANDRYGVAGTAWSITDNGFNSGYLNNGKEITEANIKELLEKAKTFGPTV